MDYRITTGDLPARPRLIFSAAARRIAVLLLTSSSFQAPFFYVSRRRGMSDIRSKREMKYSRTPLLSTL